MSESFGLSAPRVVSEAVRLGWNNLVGYGFVGGPRYVGCNLAGPDGAPAAGVVLELYGREAGDFLGALLEGADIRLYGQGQCHVGMKAAAGSIFVLQDALNTCCYAATAAPSTCGTRVRASPSPGRTRSRGRRRDHGAGLPLDPLRDAQRVRLRVPHERRRKLAARGDGPREARRRGELRLKPKP